MIERLHEGGPEGLSVRKESEGVKEVSSASHDAAGIERAKIARNRGSQGERRRMSTSITEGKTKLRRNEKGSTYFRKSNFTPLGYFYSENYFTKPED